MNSLSFQRGENFGLAGAGITSATPIAFNAPLPDAVDVVIIGGGVIGVSTALYLVEAGVKVLLCEKGRVAGEQSSRNWGWVRQQGRDLAELPIMMESIQRWSALARKYGAGLGFEQHGVLYLAHSDAELEGYEQWLTEAKACGVDSQLLTAAQVQAQLPAARPRWTGALYTPSDGRAEPWQAVPLLAKQAELAGAIVVEYCAVRQLDSQNGQITAVQTEHGTVRCEQVLLCAGAWSGLFLANLGLSIPQLNVRATVARTAACANVTAGNAVDKRLAWRRRQDGGYSLALSDRETHFIGRDSFQHLANYLPLFRRSWQQLQFSPLIPTDYPGHWHTARRWAADEVSPFERLRVLEPIPERGAATKMSRLLAERFPSLAGTPIVNLWAGMIDVMPDAVPIVDQVPGHTGLWLATGFSGHGFGIGPAIGWILAEQLQGRPAGHDMQRFRFGRFTDGSVLVPGPVI